jgi:hypothetical protein
MNATVYDGGDFLMMQLSLFLFFSSFSLFSLLPNGGRDSFFSAYLEVFLSLLYHTPFPFSLSFIVELFSHPCCLVATPRNHVYAPQR